MIEKIRNAIIGDKYPLTTPFGIKPLVYADYTASGRSLHFIEDYIRDNVLPWYANTHTETSFTGAQSTALREEARQIIRSAVNGCADDQVIFCGPGATAAINKLIDILNLRLPRDLSDRYQLEESIPAEQRPVVFVGPYEHHSNELPWRESIADVVAIPLNDQGLIDLEVLENSLKTYASRPLLIGSFSAASNVTGVKSNIETVTSLLKRHGALSFWDYAAAAPYAAININAQTPIDAVFISPHKFIGGPGTPGILIVKKSVMNNSIPAVVGGGTVIYVTPEGHRYSDNHESREEGGTPAIVESIRAGLVFKLQQEVGTDEIERREGEFMKRAVKRLSNNPNIEILGKPNVPSLSIMSLRLKHGGQNLHFGFTVSLINDLFGIQARGGCSCAGPYGHSLLDMSMQQSREIETEISQGSSILRPGWLRLNFNYFIDEQEFEYLLKAIELIAEYGWRLLPYYQFDTSSGVWRYQGQKTPLLESLVGWNFNDLSESSGSELPKPISLDGQSELALKELTRENRQGQQYQLELSSECERLRWFMLPQEAAAKLKALV